MACKDLARRSGAAVLALSSVTKEAERASTESGEIDVTAARDSLAIIHAADGVLTLQTASYPMFSTHQNKPHIISILCRLCGSCGTTTAS